VQTLSLSNGSVQDMTFLRVIAEAVDPSFSTDLGAGQTLVGGGPAVTVTIHFTPQSLGAKQAKILVDTDSSVVPAIQLSLSGVGVTRLSLALAPGTIDFGKVLVNTTATHPLTLTNQCGTAISPTLAAPQGTNATLFTTSPSAGNLLPLPDQQAVPLMVSFAPLVASGTPFQAMLAVEFCYLDGGPCSPSVGLRGLGVSTCLTFSLDPLDFGSVPTHQSVTKTVTLSNECTNPSLQLTADPAVVNDLVDGGTTIAGAFQPGYGFPVNGAHTPVAPGQSVHFPVAFRPDSAGTFTGKLYIATDDPTNANLVVLLTAIAR
jgi:hypothetical protein